MFSLLHNIAAMRKTRLYKVLFFLLISVLSVPAFSQDTLQVLPADDTLPVYNPDTTLRIINLNPFITLQVDSTLSYQLQVNKNPDNYFWFLRNSPVGLRINKDNGLLTFKADKSYFLSGKLKYDVNYNVVLGVQNMRDPTDRLDTSFTIVFYNLEIVPSKVKPAISSTIYADEGESIVFRVLCETGTFPIENILTFASRPISNYSQVQQCGDEFKWLPDYDVVKDSDTEKEKAFTLYFVGSTKFQVKDTASVKVIVRNALNYPVAKQEYQQVVKSIQSYVLQLKFTFLQLDKKIKRTKSVRTGFDLVSTGTSLTGTIMTTSADASAQRTGKILPSIGLSMVPIKEASVPSKTVDQNQATAIRSAIKRLEYLLRDNQLVGEKDYDVARKVTKLKEELKQVQVQLIDIPYEITEGIEEEELNNYFNSPKVNKKYRLKTK